MPLVKCPECEVQISDRATRCPKCGFELKKPKKKSGILLKGFVILVIAVVAIGAFAKHDKIKVALSGETHKDKEVDESTPASELSIGADELISAYKANEVAADSKYKGKMCTVSGYVHGISKDAFGGVYVTVKGEGRLVLQTIHCELKRQSEISKSSNLKPDDKVTVVGQIGGLSLLNIRMKDCVFQEATKTTDTTNNPSSSTDVQRSAPTEPVHAKVLIMLDEFAADKFSANKKYKGKMVSFTEKADHSSVDQMDKLRLYIDIGLNRGAVVCYFKDDENDTKANKLRSGETVSIIGELKVGESNRLEFVGCVIQSK